MSKTFVLSGVFTILFSSLAFAGNLHGAFDSLKNLGANFEPDGAVCEELEKVRLGQLYPADKFLISGDIEYSTGKETIGELDTVVIDRSNGKVILLGEVKCWKNMEDGLMKAKAQMMRFIWTLGKHPESLIFTSYDGIKYTAAQFSTKTPIYTVGPLGAVAHGADYEFELTLKETQQLRMMLLKCQQNGECPRPE